MHGTALRRAALRCTKPGPGRLQQRTRTMAIAVPFEWQANLLTHPADISNVAGTAKVVAVLGCKTEAQASQPAYFVPEYLKSAGVKVLPVLTFYPEVTEVLGTRVVRKVADLSEPYDILCVFRKPSDLMAHLEDILAAPHKPPVVWLQSGIQNPEFEEALAKQCIKVVHDRCLMVEHRAAARGRL